MACPILGVLLAASLACPAAAPALPGFHDGPDRARAAPAVPGGEEIIVFTANQEWLSRIYILDLDGTVIDYHEYEFYRFVDLEVINNEVYAAEAFAPRVYRVDLDSGALDVVVDDWLLYYFYDVAFDGTHLYVTEWDLNRYLLDGTKTGSTPFEGTPYGGACDESFYWTMMEGGQVRCWDLSQWPAISAVAENDFPAPSPHCRGLVFDGQYFWTAESIESTLGFIYQFDHDGAVVRQWLAPAYRGWAACIVTRSLPGDLDGDGDVDVLDLLALLADWGACPGGECPADLNGDGVVNVLDLLILLANWT